ncbi:hypothetical protein [Amnibacterium sp.]|uniref:hypothetical protein n=1 Tax=Amnibacterium sp. TaxID=1872496 RepID=UPI003F7C1D6B
MLVTIDAIAERFADEDSDRLWSRLTDRSRPAIWFQLLPIDDMGAAESLYIKMNSRGKPLTEFEAFKAHLGQLVGDVGGFEQFGHRIDGEWTDVLWPYRGDDDIVDDEFMRYFDFLMEVCEWREGRLGSSSTESPADRISRLLGSTNERRHEHLAFIRFAFDTWVDEPSIAQYFDELFALESDGVRVRLFGANATTDLFAACLRRYGEARGATRVFSLADTLLLLAVLEHRRYGSADPHARLRTVRNVSEASQFELRVTNMPNLTSETSIFTRSGDLESLRTFNANQVRDEALKRELLDSTPDVAEAVGRLEDHPILRGTLAAFDLDESISARAAAFDALFVSERFPLLTGALLAAGEYQRNIPNSDQHRFGSPSADNVWRSVLVDRGDRQSLEQARLALRRMLDQVATSPDDPSAALMAFSDQFTVDRAARNHFDWRYHLVQYPTMREGGSGIYYGAHERIGYELTMLRKTAQNSYYRDAYLYAIWCEAGRPVEVKDPWFSGYSTTPRWMELVRSGTAMRSVESGFAIRESAILGEARDRLAELCAAGGGVRDGPGWLIQLTQEDHDGGPVDTIDRVQRGTELLQSFIAAGL